MKPFLLMAVAVAFVGQALADVNYDLGKKQARRDVNQSNEQQGIAPGPSAAPAAPPLDSALAATLQNIADLRADLDALNQAPDAQAGADQRSSLLNHLSAAAAPGKKASAGAVKTLAGHLIGTLSGKTRLTAQNAKIARSLHALFNSAHLTDVQQATQLAGVEKILTAAGIPAADAAKVVGDLKQIAAETR